MTRRRVRLCAVFFSVVLASAALCAQTTAPIITDILGKHDMSGGGSPVRGANANACIYCHTPHSGLSTTLWNQTLSTGQYTLNPSATSEPGSATSVNRASALCLSCHDGTVAVGSTVAIGTLQMIGAVQPSGTLTDSLGTSLQGSHPFSFKTGINASPSVVDSLSSSQTTLDPSVQLIGGNIECSTCHNVHNEYLDTRERKFLVRDNTRSALCFACHDTATRTVSGITNPLVGYPVSAHQNPSTANVSVALKAGLGGYDKVSEFACLSCHTSHAGLGLALLHVNPNRPPQTDDTSQSCVLCHDGSDNLLTPIANVLVTMNAAGQVAHPFADSNNPHAPNEPVILNANRHSTCADCHNAHVAQQTTSFTLGGTTRPSQLGVPGVQSGGVITASSTYQYETCLRCHSTSNKKQSLSSYGYLPSRGLFTGDPLDVSLQFAHSATSSHPVMRDATQTELAGKSVLGYVYNVDWKQGRAMSSRALCTDCHNNENNREFGGTSPNGPHGSRNAHILERQYLMNTVGVGALPGSTIINLNIPPVLTPGPGSQYALCAKCHDLNLVNTAASWVEHPRHINDGFSCSVCHSAHGVQAATLGVIGRGLVSFDLNVVGQSNGQPITYNGTSCTLRCHNHDHS